MGTSNDTKSKSVKFELKQKPDPAKQTFTQTGTVISKQINSLTVIVMCHNKSTVKQSEYPVTMQDGKWHQVGKRLGIDGKVTSTGTIELHRF